MNYMVHNKSIKLTLSSFLILNIISVAVCGFYGNKHFRNLAFFIKGKMRFITTFLPFKNMEVKFPLDMESKFPALLFTHHLNLRRLIFFQAMLPQLYRPNKCSCISEMFQDSCYKLYKRFSIMSVILCTHHIA